VLTPYVLRKSSVSMGFHALEAAKLSVMATAATVVPGSSPAAASLMLVITELVYRSSAFILLKWDLSCPVKNRADPTAQMARAAAPRASAVMEAIIAAAPFLGPAVTTTLSAQVHVLSCFAVPLGTTSGSRPVMPE